MTTYREEIIRLLNKATDDPNDKVYQMMYTLYILQQRNDLVDKNRMYNIVELSEILHISRRTIYRYLKDGTIKGIKTGRDWRFTQEEVERLKGIK